MNTKKTPKKKRAAKYDSKLKLKGGFISAIKALVSEPKPAYVRKQKK